MFLPARDVADGAPDGLVGTRAAGCYQLDGPAWANGTTVFVHVGDASGDAELALPKSQDWVDPTFLNETDQLSGLRTCVNAKGEATLRF